MKELKQSKTTIIKRSHIHLNPFNPKVHTDEKIKIQKRNLQDIGFLGGVTWNKTSGNLIDGHRRIQAMDLYYKYDGSAEADYDVKVESVELSEKTEKEQMTYMALGNTKADLDLVSKFIGDIDYSKAGISDEEHNEIMRRCAIDDFSNIETFDFFDNDKKDYEQSYDQRKAAVKEAKAQIKEKTIENTLNQESYITVSFSDFQAKTAFCELINVDPRTTKFIKGEDLLNIIE